MGVHDEITEEFFADSPVQVTDHFPCQGPKLKGQSHKVHFVLKAYLNKTLLSVRTDF
jgi:hypothetical protein